MQPAGGPEKRVRRFAPHPLSWIAASCSRCAGDGRQPSSSLRIPDRCAIRRFSGSPPVLAGRLPLSASRKTLATPLLSVLGRRTPHQPLPCRPRSDVGGPGPGRLRRPDLRPPPSPPYPRPRDWHVVRRPSRCFPTCARWTLAALNGRPEPVGSGAAGAAWRSEAGWGRLSDPASRSLRGRSDSCRNPPGTGAAGGGPFDFVLPVPRSRCCFPASLDAPRLPDSLLRESGSAPGASHGPHGDSSAGVRPSLNATAAVRGGGPPLAERSPPWTGVRSLHGSGAAGAAFRAKPAGAGCRPRAPLDAAPFPAPERGRQDASRRFLKARAMAPDPVL